MTLDLFPDDCAIVGRETLAEEPPYRLDLLPPLPEPQLPGDELWSWELYEGGRFVACGFGGDRDEAERCGRARLALAR